MLSLTLVRHAKSSWDDAGLDDFMRPLNDRGRRDAPMMAQRFLRSAPSPVLLVSSPAVRAAATASTFAEALDVPQAAIKLEPGIYEASADKLLEIVRGFDDAHASIVMFGHNPGFTDLCHRLARCDFTEMPTCAVARFEFDVDHWKDIAAESGRLMAYSFPKERQ